MSNQDIFDQFREQADQLRETPSADTWSRIEHRLQADRPKIERTRVRHIRRQAPAPLSIAAGIALLIGLSVVFLWTSEQSATPAAIVAQATPLEWEELILTPTETSPTEVVEIAATLDRPAITKPIEEGRASQRLVAKNEVRSNGEINHSQQDSARRKQEERMGR